MLRREGLPLAAACGIHDSSQLSWHSGSGLMHLDLDSSDGWPCGSAIWESRGVDASDARGAGPVVAALHGGWMTLSGSLGL